MVRGGDALHENRVEQTESQADAEENSDHRMAKQSRRQRDKTGEHNAHGEQPQGPESNGRKHQRRVLRWRRHGVTSIPRSRGLSQ
jgi:hypothetical protein